MVTSSAYSMSEPIGNPRPILVIFNPFELPTSFCINKDVASPSIVGFVARIISEISLPFFLILSINCGI
ncbi:hypothetical protein D3C83_262050 [compost metagenome]